VPLLRLGGGDAVLLRSPPLPRILLEGEDERIRPASELWEEALRRNKWTAAHHLRGDGLGARLGTMVAPRAERSAQEAAKPGADHGEGGDPDPEDAGEDGDRDAEATASDSGGKWPAGISSSATGREWRKYAGDPLIFSQQEFNVLVNRSGSTTRPTGKDTTARVRPLIYGFNPPPTAREKARMKKKTDTNVAKLRSHAFMLAGAMRLKASQGAV